GKVVRGWLGIEMQEVGDLPDPAALGLKEPRGVVITRVMPNSPAEKAGLQSQDVIVEFNGVPIRSAAHLQSLVGRTPPGTTVPLKIVRGGKETIVNVTLSERTPEVVAEAMRNAEWRGMLVGELTPELRRQMGVPEDIRGVVVMSVEPGSPAARAGIRQGDIITVIANQRITSISDFARVIGNIRPNRSAAVTIRRENATTMLVIPPEQ
ncbi:MAG: PDZ domain-containing protein, partial [Armatimonadetes bacterium]|nr:PDZ domain-containing protein [Armatimonadota bacterium]